MEIQIDPDDLKQPKRAPAKPAAKQPRKRTPKRPKQKRVPNARRPELVYEVEIIPESAFLLPEQPCAACQRGIFWRWKSTERSPWACLACRQPASGNIEWHVLPSDPQYDEIRRLSQGLHAFLQSTGQRATATFELRHS